MRRPPITDLALADSAVVLATLCPRNWHRPASSDVKHISYSHYHARHCRVDAVLVLPCIVIMGHHQICL